MSDGDSATEEIERLRRRLERERRARAEAEAIAEKGTRLLYERERDLREVVENITEALWMTDLVDNRVLYVSPRYEQIWQQPREALLASPLAWSDGLHADDRERISQAVMPGPEQSYRIVRPDKSVRWIRHRSYPVRDEATGHRHMICVAEDITDRKRLEEQFLRAQRVDAIGSLASGIAHDLNNILTPVLMAASTLRYKPLDEASVELVSMIENGARRGADVIKQLLSFSRGMEGKRTWVDPKPLLGEIAALIRETFPRTLTLVQNCSDRLPALHADATQLHQVLVNLCVNARDAMPGGGRLTLAANLAELGPKDVHIHAAAKPGPYIVMSVTDSGTGIRPEVLARIFDPFFTTKELGRGTGLGLSSALGIVQNHGGFITVYSEVGSGSVFKVYLPAAREALPDGPRAKAEHAFAGSGELILVVDDEPAICAAVRVVLEEHRYRVVTASDGQDALAKFAQRHGEVRLVLTDLMMPVMAGPALVRSLRALNPKLKILAASGLNEEAKQTELALMGVPQILSKPYEPIQLLRAIHQELNPL